MPRVCTVCTHPSKAEINKALLDKKPYRDIASRYDTSTATLLRHREHMPRQLAKAQEAAEVAHADDLLSQLKGLRNKAVNILLQAEKAGDYRTALMGVREARACLELLAELEGELDRRPQMNILMAPEWVVVRATLFEALHPYTEARAAVAGALLQLEAGNG